MYAMNMPQAPVEGSHLWTLQRHAASTTIPTRCGAAAIARVSHSPCSSHACLNRWRSARAFSSSPFRITFFCALKHFSSRYFCSLHAPVSRPQYPTSSWHCLKANILSTHSGLLCSDSVGCMRPGPANKRRKGRQAAVLPSPKSLDRACLRARFFNLEGVKGRPCFWLSDRVPLCPRHNTDEHGFICLLGAGGGRRLQLATTDDMEPLAGGESFPTNRLAYAC